MCLSVCLSVRPSVTSRCSTETTKRRIVQITPHSPVILVFWCRKSRQNQPGHHNRGAKYRWRRLSAGAVAENWRLSTRSVVILARSQVYHTERPRYLFAATMQRVARVCQRQLILVTYIFWTSIFARPRIALFTVCSVGRALGPFMAWVGLG